MTTAEFLRNVEDYYGSQYKRAQIIAVRDWCSKKQGRVLQSVYNMLIQHFEATKYQTLPLIKNLQAVIEEAVEILPDLPPSGALQITDGEQDYRNRISEMFRQLIEKRKIPKEEATNAE